MSPSFSTFRPYSCVASSSSSRYLPHRMRSTLPCSEVLCSSTQPYAEQSRSLLSFFALCAEKSAASHSATIFFKELITSCTNSEAPLSIGSSLIPRLDGILYTEVYILLMIHCIREEVRSLHSSDVPQHLTLLRQHISHLHYLFPDPVFKALETSVLMVHNSWTHGNPLLQHSLDAFGQLILQQVESLQAAILTGTNHLSHRPSTITLSAPLPT